jgi:hypothetical protein
MDRDVFSVLVNMNDIYLEYLHPDTFFGLQYINCIILHKNSDLQIQTDRNLITSHYLSHLDISSCIHCQLKHLQTSQHWDGLT